MANIGSTIRLGAPGGPDAGVGPGDTVGGRFRVEGLIGWGGQAVVFRASDLAAGDALALKVARRDLDQQARHEAAEVLAWEAGLLRRLRHPALPRLRRSLSGPQAAWLARELVPGESLAGLARSRRFSQEQVLAMALQLCDLLTYLHTRPTPVVCGDLKPANLILRPDGRLALVDLGAASTLTRRPPRRPRPRHGTPGYAAPEQMAGRGVDERGDLFALAVTCYELITGEDPALAPLQLDLRQLERRAPRLAPALRWALEFEPDRRSPSAAALRTRLGAPRPAPPLALGPGAAVGDLRGLALAATRHPAALGALVAGGELEAWLAAHPDADLGRLRYALRQARAAAPPRQGPAETLLAAMAPPEGSPLLAHSPARIDFGPMPLRSWRIWGRPQALTLHNTALAPQRWELECPRRPDSELRVIVDGRPQRQAAGVLAAGERLALELVNAGAVGPRSGVAVLRCGQHRWEIPWAGVAAAGLTVGGRHVARPEQLDLGWPGLVPELEQLLGQGSLARWLRATGRAALARQLDQAMAQRPDELGRRLLVGRVLHTIAPERFPALELRGPAPGQGFEAGQPAYLWFELLSAAAWPYPLQLRSLCPWAAVAAAPDALAPAGATRVGLRIVPPHSLRGTQPIALELRAGDLPLQIVLSVSVRPERWWQRLRRLISS